MMVLGKAVSWEFGNNVSNSSQSMKNRNPVTVRCCLALLLVLGLATVGPLHAAGMKLGARTPYRIALRLAVDSCLRPQEELAARLASDLGQRIDATMSPFWDLDISILQGKARHRLLAWLNPIRVVPITGAQTPLWYDSEGEQTATGMHTDKEMLLTVKTLPVGYRISCREWDAYVRRWGPIQQRTLSQRSLLAESCFQLMRETFAPLAVVHPLSLEKGSTSPARHMVLQFKGSQLATESIEQLFLHAGDVYQPLLRRTDRSGELLSVSEVPWTYLALTEVQPAKGESHGRQWLARSYSGLRHPFGARLRGRSELLALAMHGAEPRTQVRFFARHDRDQALSGYEVFQQGEREKSASRLLGVTNARGMIEVRRSPLEREPTPVVMLLVRSDGRLLAKVPVVPGVAALVEVPIADDAARLQAQARLVEVREQLVDLVARRNILLARARNYLNQGQIDQAQQLLEDLDALPGRSQFDKILSAAENQPSNRSEDPLVQARIAKLFANTRSLLGRSLDTRPVRDLQNELNVARREKAAQAPS